MSAALKRSSALEFKVVVTGGPHSGLELEPKKEKITIGRGPENDIVFTNDPKISRSHIEIRRRDQEIIVLNLSQRNHLYVDGEIVQSVSLTEQSEVQIGDTVLRVEWVKPEAIPEADLATSVGAVISEISGNETSSADSPAGDSNHSTQAPVVATNAPVSFGNIMPQEDVPGHLAALKNNQRYPQPQMPQPPAFPQTPMGGGNFGGNPYGQPQENYNFQKKDNKMPLLIGVVVIVGAALFLMADGKKKKRSDSNAIRTSSVALDQYERIDTKVEEMKALQKEKDSSPLIRRAEEAFKRGFRDYQQSQYGRAIDSFQLVVNLAQPGQTTELARTYLRLSKTKFEELVKANMLQGARYYDKKNWRMCKNSYGMVMTMLGKKSDDPNYKEASRFYESCNLNSGDNL